MMTQDLPSSPSTTTRKVLTQPTIVPLDSATRQVPIHPDLPSIKVPGNNPDLKPYQYHPVTCEPLTNDDLTHHNKATSTSGSNPSSAPGPNIQQLQKQFPTPEAAERALMEAVREVKMKLEESEEKRKEVEREMEELKKTREMERKVYEKMKEGKART
jgi:hypothetical protein